MRDKYKVYKQTRIIQTDILIRHCVALELIEQSLFKLGLSLT